MNNQKKVEEILYSIQELILEAQNEERLERLETNEIIELNKINQSSTENPLKKQDFNELTLNKTIKKKDVVLPKNNSHSKNSWRDLNFENCQKKSQNLPSNEINKENLENDLEKMFKESLNFWIKKELPDLIKEETALHTKKILLEKLK